MTILITYPLMSIKGWLLDGDYIVWMIMSYLSGSMVREFTCKRILSKKNKSSVQCIDGLNIKTAHEITEISKNKNWVLTYHLLSSYDLIMTNRLYILFYVDQSNGRSIIWWWLENWDFVWSRLKILSIIKVDKLLVTWKIADRLLLSVWINFSRWAHFLLKRL